MDAKICMNLKEEINKFHNIFDWGDFYNKELEELSDRISGKVVELRIFRGNAFEKESNHWCIPEHLYEEI